MSPSTISGLPMHMHRALEKRQVEALSAAEDLECSQRHYQEILSLVKNNEVMENTKNYAQRVPKNIVSYFRLLFLRGLRSHPARVGKSGSLNRWDSSRALL